MLQNLVHVDHQAITINPDSPLGRTLRQQGGSAFLQRFNARMLQKADIQRRQQAAAREGEQLDRTNARYDAVANAGKTAVTTAVNTARAVAGAIKDYYTWNAHDQADMKQVAAQISQEGNSLLKDWKKLTPAQRALRRRQALQLYDIEQARADDDERETNADTGISATEGAMSGATGGFYHPHVGHNQTVIGAFQAAASLPVAELNGAGLGNLLGGLRGAEALANAGQLERALGEAGEQLATRLPYVRGAATAVGKVWDALGFLRPVVANHLNNAVSLGVDTLGRRLAGDRTAGWHSYGQDLQNTALSTTLNGLLNAGHGALSEHVLPSLSPRSAARSPPRPAV